MNGKIPALDDDLAWNGSAALRFQSDAEAEETLQALFYWRESLAWDVNDETCDPEFAQEVRDRVAALDAVIARFSERET